MLGWVRGCGKMPAARSTFPVDLERCPLGPTFSRCWAYDVRRHCTDTAYGPKERRQVSSGSMQLSLVFLNSQYLLRGSKSGDTAIAPSEARRVRLSVCAIKGEMHHGACEMVHTKSTHPYEKNSEITDCDAFMGVACYGKRLRLNFLPTRIANCSSFVAS